MDLKYMPTTLAQQEWSYGSMSRHENSSSNDNKGKETGSDDNEDATCIVVFLVYKNINIHMKALLLDVLIDVIVPS